MVALRDIEYPPVCYLTRRKAEYKGIIKAVSGNLYEQIYDVMISRYVLPGGIMGNTCS